MVARSYPAGSEQERLYVLQSTRLLDTLPTERFDRITRLATQFFGAPCALVSLIDRDRQWFKSRVGVGMQQTERSIAFCDHTIRSGEVFVVENALTNPLFADNPLVTGEPGIRFYAGAPLLMESGHALGSLCILDTEPREFSAEERRQLQDIAALVMTEIDLHRSAGRVDDLTLLPNRAQMQDDLLDLCLLKPGEARALVVLEVMGHRALQDLFRAVGIPPLEQLMRDTAREFSTLADGRWTIYGVGTGRFAFVLPAGDMQTSSARLESMLLLLKERVSANTSLPQMQMHAGITPFLLKTDEVDDAMRKAVSAVYQATIEQRLLVAYSPDLDVSHQRAYALIQDLPRAFRDNEIYLDYQPKFNVRSGRYESVEALVRWQHHTLGNIPPGDFIPQVEQSALIHLLTEWVLHKALAQSAQWRAEGLRVAIAVNVSATNLERPDFLQSIENACAVHGVPYAALHIECTENVVLTGASTVATLQAIRALGVQVALDDFGIGYCNLSCLHNLPAEILKLDQSLIAPIAVNPRAWEIVQSIIALGHELGYRMLAEGVETKQIFDMLVAAGCDGIQGYYLARPMKPADVATFIRAQEKTLLHASADALPGGGVAK